jgi:hypothetical protein
MLHELTTDIDEMKRSKPFYRKLFVAHLIDNGCNTQEALRTRTQWNRRTVQQVINTLQDIDIILVHDGKARNRIYSIKDWGAIDKKWIKDNLKNIKNVLI